MKKIISYIFLTLTLILGCAFAVQAAETEHKPADIPGLTFDHSMDLSYAKEFNVDYYNDGYALLTIDQEGQFLVVPEGKKAPEGLDPDIAVLQQPINNIYLVATSAVPANRLTIFLETRLTWMVILPSLTVSSPFLSLASFT